MPSTPSLLERLSEDAKAALRAGDKNRLSVLRMAVAAIKQREIDSRETLDEAGAQGIVEKMVKQRREAAEQFKVGKREDLADKEAAEIVVLRAYLPAPMSEAETSALVEDVISELAASAMKDMGRVMGEIKKRAAGSVDLGRVSGMVRARLSGE